VLQVPLRNPVELAHRILTAHLISGGRLLLGVGAGSTRADFDALGLDFTERLQAFEDALPVMRRLWRGEKVGAANLTPWPTALGGPAVLIGSWGGKRWIPRAAQEFDGWIASAGRTNLNTLTEGIQRYRAAGGKRAIATNISVDLTGPTEPCPDDGPLPPPRPARGGRPAAPASAGPGLRRRGAGRQERLGGEPGRGARAPHVAPP
jgi:alkanesulfonate monooxygenase SsuD/methylene tetrahydromethanopterin reductase-like flavin-dependent oxidoreductase (luciferase family)